MIVKNSHLLQSILCYNQGPSRPEQRIYREQHRDHRQ